jgi:hypothetical protein
MGSGPMVITEIRIQGSFQMLSVENNEMVQAVSSDRTDQAFGVRILPDIAPRHAGIFPKYLFLRILRLHFCVASASAAKISDAKLFAF